MTLKNIYHSVNTTAQTKNKMIQTEVAFPYSIVLKAVSGVDCVAQIFLRKTAKLKKQATARIHLIEIPKSFCER